MIEGKDGIRIINGEAINPALQTCGPRRVAAVPNVFDSLSEFANGNCRQKQRNVVSIGVAKELAYTRIAFAALARFANHIGIHRKHGQLGDRLALCVGSVQEGKANLRKMQQGFKDIKS